MRTIWQFKLNRHDDPDPAPDGGKPADDKPAGDKLPQFTGDFDPERAQRAIASAREAEKAAKAQAQEALVRAQEQKAQLDKVLAALGKNPDGTDGPVTAEQLQEQIQASHAAAWRAGTELAVIRAAGRLGGDAEKLLDSMAFIDSLDDLIEADPSSADFRSAVDAKVTEALERNPAYKTAPARPAPDPSQGRGGDSQAVDYRTAPKAEFDKELAKLGLRPRSLR